MKRIYLLLFIFPVLGENSFAQTRIDKDTTLPFDLLNPNGNFPGDFTIKKNVRFRYFIDNINRNVYTITLNSEAKSLFVEKPPIFGVISDVDLSKLSAPAGDQSALSGEPLAVLTEKSTDAEKLALARYTSTQTALTGLIDAFKQKNDQLKKLNALYQSLSATLQDGQNTFKTLFDGKQAATYALLSQSFAYTGSSTDEVALLAALRKASSELLEGLGKTYDDLVRKHSEYKLQLASVEQAGTAKVKQLTDAKAKAKKPDQPAIQKAMDDIGAEVNYEKLLAEGIAELVGDIRVNYTKVSEMEQSGFTENLATVYQKINQTNWQYISPSIRGQKDEITVKLDVEPKEMSIHSPNYAQFNGEYIGEVYGFKVNFSTGLFMLIGKSLFDRSYRVDTIAGDPENNIIVENDRRQSVQPAVGALMHFYNKKPGSFSWGGAFGFSISDETRLNYHGGLSFLFGQEQRVIANLGVTLTRVEEIGSAYSVDQKVTRSSGFNTVPTEKFYRAGAFVALTYNLSN